MIVIGVVIWTVRMGYLPLSPQKPEPAVSVFGFQNEKSIRISFMVKKDVFTVTDMRVLFAQASALRRNFQFGKWGLTVRLLDCEGGLLERFQIWDPRFGRLGEGKPIIIPRSELTFDLIVPFHQGIKTVELVEPGVRVEVTELIAEFCEKYPDDSHCK